MLVLLETPAGYAIFKFADAKKLKSVEDINSIFNSEKSLSQKYSYS